MPLSSRHKDVEKWDNIVEKIEKSVVKLLNRLRRDFLWKGNKKGEDTIYGYVDSVKKNQPCGRRSSLTRLGQISLWCSNEDNSRISVGKATEQCFGKTLDWASNITGIRRVASLLNVGEAFPGTVSKLDSLRWRHKGDGLLSMNRTHKEDNMVQEESNGFNLSKTKTEYLECKFSIAMDEADVEARLATLTIPKRENFKYLGSIIQGSRDIDDNVTHHIGAAWTKWKLASRVLCDKKVPLKLKGKFYKAVVRPSLMYGVELISGHNRSDKIRNEVIQEKVGVASVANKMKEARLRWFRHVQRRCINASGNGLAKKVLGEVIRQVMVQLHITEDMTLDRKEWRLHIRHQEAARSNKEKQVIIPEQKKTDGVCELKPKAKTQGCKATERELMKSRREITSLQGKGCSNSPTKKNHQTFRFQEAVRSLKSHLNTCSFFPSIYTKILAKLVPDNQNALVKGRQIINAAMVANKCLEYLNKRKMKQMSFDDGLSGKNIVFLQFFSVLINGYDTPILYEAEKDQLLHHRGVLLACEVVSGLKVNLAKSTVFSINAEHCSDDLAGILSCEVEQLPTTYLAQPLGEVFDRCSSKLVPWEKHYLSFGGRLILVNNVLDVQSSSKGGVWSTISSLWREYSQFVKLKLGNGICRCSTDKYGKIAGFYSSTDWIDH
ncbi:hypothetical protein H5410_060231 [Solanum commersonii]|uniref:Uncharacterized protein n=1 Tax=Solanum commersonii TaxID=4109 RepID=A0A9J5W4W2_SOLCO|nr:hypothetical protein H5410_060231 [Solanum commersonii]